jgi:Fe-S-cluster containining protein
MEVARLCRHLSLAEDDFLARYTLSVRTKRVIAVDAAGRCVFFREGVGCAVHEVKPAVCRAWPFFRGNLVDPVSLGMAKGFCPGIAPEVSHEVFARQGMSFLVSEGLLAHDSATEANTLILD